MQVVKIAAAFLFLSGLVTLNGPAFSAPACKGPNKYDPGCPDAATESAVEEPAPEEPVTAAAAVDNATVDWLNQKIVLRGSGFTGTTQFILGGSSPLVPASVSDTVAELNCIPGAVIVAAGYGVGSAQTWVCRVVAHAVCCPSLIRKFTKSL